MKARMLCQSFGTVRTLFVIMSSIAIISLLPVSCGKLTDDSDQPYEPTDPYTGQTIPMADPDTLGAYSLTLTVDDATLPADSVTYTELHARLHNSDGQSVEHFTMKFNTTEQSDGIGLFLNPGTTYGTGSPSPTTTGRTNSAGGVSVRLYGVQSGSCVVQASVDIDGIGEDDLYKTVVVVMTPAGPPNAAGAYRLELSASPSRIPGDAGTPSIVTAKLVDTRGGSVQNFKITLEDVTQFGGFEGGGGTGTTGTVGPTTYEGTTDANGQFTVRYYGETPGTALIRATVTVGDLVGDLINTVRVEVYEVKVENPTIILESQGTVSLYYRCTGTGTEEECSSDTEPLDAVLRVQDAAGNRIGGVTLAYSIVHRQGCTAVKFNEIFGTVTTNLSGRAQIEATVEARSRDGGTTCSYDLEILYDDVLYNYDPANPPSITYESGPPAGTVDVND